MDYAKEYDRMVEQSNKQQMEIDRLTTLINIIFDIPTFPLGTTVEKIKGSEWEGKVVGFYSTSLTPRGYAVESSTHAGSVQIYPESALRKKGTHLGEQHESTA